MFIVCESVLCVWTKILKAIYGSFRESRCHYICCFGWKCIFHKPSVLLGMCNDLCIVSGQLIKALKWNFSQKWTFLLMLQADEMMLQTWICHSSETLKTVTGYKCNNQCSVVEHLVQWSHCRHCQQNSVLVLLTMNNFMATWKHKSGCVDFNYRCC